MDCSSAIKAIFYIGVGIIAISGFVVGVIYARSADKYHYSHISKLAMKVSFDGTYNTWNSSIAISVFGFLAFAAAITTIILSILLSDNTIVLIICGIISSVLILGCVISEGLFTKYTITEKSIDDGFYQSQNHKSAQKYIKNAIEELYKQGYRNLKDEYKDDIKDAASWSDVEKKLGKKNKDDKIITYNTIWSNSQTDNIIRLYNDGNNIMAKYNGYDIKIATRKFVDKDKVYDYGDKMRICWYKSDYSDIKCKNIDYEPERIDEKVEYTIGNYGSFTLNENIVVGDYISRADAKKRKIDVNYKVSNFPIAYSLMDYKEKVDRSKDSRHFRVSAKDLLKAEYKDIKDQSKINKYETPFYMVPGESSSIKDINKKCKKGDYPSNACICEYVYIQGGDSDECNLDDVSDYIMENYKDEYKGKTPSSVKKLYDGITRNNLNTKTWINHQDLYTFAIVSMSVQLLGMVLLIVGMFLPGGYMGVGND